MPVQIQFLLWNEILCQFASVYGSYGQELNPSTGIWEVREKKKGNLNYANEPLFKV